MEREFLADRMNGLIENVDGMHDPRQYVSLLAAKALLNAALLHKVEIEVSAQDTAESLMRRGDPRNVALEIEGIKSNDPLGLALIFATAKDIAFISGNGEYGIAAEEFLDNIYKERKGRLEEQEQESEAESIKVVQQAAVAEVERTIRFGFLKNEM